MFCKSNSPIPDELILIKLYTVALYGLGICMKEDNPGLKNIKGDNYLCGMGLSFCDLVSNNYKLNNVVYTKFYPI